VDIHTLGIGNYYIAQSSQLAVRLLVDDLLNCLLAYLLTYLLPP